MPMSDSNVTRYSDAELEEFRALLEKKLEKAENERDRIHSRLSELEEQADSDRSDYIDDSSNYYDVEQLNVLEHRQRKHIQDLKNALIRIKNNTYGICTVTGELIDKRRLMAVPTTTKSLEAKMRPADSSAKDEDNEEKAKKKATSQEKKIITKVIKKNPSTPKPPVPEEDDEDDLLGFDANIPDADDEDDDQDLDNLVHPDYAGDDF
jgi:RNA polymerase-binding transcription factor DksA